MKVYQNKATATEMKFPVFKKYLLLEAAAAVMVLGYYGIDICIPSYWKITISLFVNHLSWSRYKKALSLISMEKR